MRGGPRRQQSNQEERPHTAPLARPMNPPPRVGSAQVPATGRSKACAPSYEVRDTNLDLGPPLYGKASNHGRGFQKSRNSTNLGAPWVFDMRSCSLEQANVDPFPASGEAAAPHSEGCFSPVRTTIGAPARAHLL